MDYTKITVETLAEARIDPNDWMKLMTMLAKLAEVVENAFYAKAIRQGEVLAFKDSTAFAILWQARYQRQHWPSRHDRFGFDTSKGGTVAGLTVKVSIIIETDWQEFACLPGQLFLSLGIDRKWFEEACMEITDQTKLDPSDYAAASIYYRNRPLLFVENPDWREMNFAKLGKRIARSLLDQLDRCAGDLDYLDDEKEA